MAIVQRQKKTPKPTRKVVTVKTFNKSTLKALDALKAQQAAIKDGQAVTHADRTTAVDTLIDALTSTLEA